MNVTGTTAAAADLINIENSVTDGVTDVEATSLTNLTGSTEDAITILSDTDFEDLGDEAVEISDTTLGAARLNVLDTKTDGAVDASSVTTLTGDVSDVNAAYTANGLGTVTGLGNEALDLADTTIAAADLKTADANTDGTVDASDVTSISGNGTDMASVYGSSGISGLGNETTIEVTDAGTNTAAAADLNTIVAKINATAGSTSSVTVNANITTITGTGSAVKSVYDAKTASDLTGVGDEAITISGETTSSASDINAIVSATSGTINTVTNVSTISGSLTNIQTFQTNVASGRVSPGLNYDVTITDTGTLVAQDLLDLIAPGAGKTFGTINIADVSKVTGTEAEITSFLAKIASNTISADAAIDIDIYDASSAVTTVTAANLNTFDDYTLGTIGAPQATTVTGTVSAISEALTSSGISVASDIDATFDTIATADADDVTDINTITANTSGTVSGTLTGTAAILDDLNSNAGFSATANLTISVSDAQSGSGGVTALNTISAASAGTVTASLSGNKTDLANLSTSGTDDAITITVTDAVSASEGEALTGKSSTAVVFQGGVSDTLGNLSSDDGTTATRSTDLAAILGDDADVDVTVTGFTNPVDAAEVRQLNVIAAGTSGGVTASITGAKATLANLSTSGTDDAITITVTDAVSASEGEALTGKSSTAVVFQGGVSDSLGNLSSDDGTTATRSSDLAAILGDDADVDVTVTGFTNPVDAAEVRQLNVIAAGTSGGVTASITGAKATLANLSTSGTDDAITITVTDAVSASEGEALTGKSSTAVVFQGGVSDSLGNLSSDDGTTATRSTDLAAILGDDADADVTVTGFTNPVDAAEVRQLNVIAAGTSGGVTASITGAKATLANLSTSGTDDAITITVTDAVSASEGEALTGKSSTAVVFQGGVSDSLGNLSSDDGTTATRSSDLAAILGDDADADVTVTGFTNPVDAAEVRQLNVIAAGTSGGVTASITGAKATLANLSTSGTDDAITITVTDAVSASEGGALAGKTDGDDRLPERCIRYLRQPVI